MTETEILSEVVRRTVRDEWGEVSRAVLAALFSPTDKIENTGHSCERAGFGCTHNESELGTVWIDGNGLHVERDDGVIANAPIKLGSDRAPRNRSGRRRRFCERCHETQARSPRSDDGRWLCLRCQRLVAEGAVER